MSEKTTVRDIKKHSKKDKLVIADSSAADSVDVLQGSKKDISDKKRKIGSLAGTDTNDKLKLDISDAIIVVLSEQSQKMMARKALRKIVMKPHQLDKTQMKSVFEEALELLERNKKLTLDIDETVTLTLPSLREVKTVKPVEVISHPVVFSTAVSVAAPSSATKTKIMAPSRMEDKAKVIIIKTPILSPQPTSSATPLKSNVNSSITPVAKKASTTSTPTASSATKAQIPTSTATQPLKGSLGATILQVLNRRAYPDAKTLREMVLEEHTGDLGDRDAAWNAFKKELALLTKGGQVSSEGGSIRLGTGGGVANSTTWSLDQVKQLRALVPQHTKQKEGKTSIKWKAIAAELERNESDCKDRWEVLSKSSVKR